jgi:plasmid stabilization system protein ParE
MKLKWTNQAIADVARLYEFLVKVNLSAATRAAQNLTAVPLQLLERPQTGRQLEQYLPREVRRLIVSNYEIRYEVADFTVYILRIWHTREER